MARRGEQPRARVKLASTTGASPAVVVRAVTLLAELVRAAGHDLAADDYTIVVSNRSMKSELRAWSDSGERGLDRIAHVMKQPHDAIEEDADSLEIAEALAKFGAPLTDDGIVLSFGRSRTRIDARFVSMMAGVSAAVPSKVVMRRVGTTIESRVLRVGRPRVDRGVQVRVEIRSKSVDLALDAEMVAQFDEAMEKGTVHLIHVEAPYVERPDGSRTFDWSRGRALRLREVRSSTGPMLLHMMKKLPRENVRLALESLTEDE